MLKTHKKLKIALLAIIAVLIVIRVVLPIFILNNLNKYLADFSPAFKFHIDDLDLGVWRAAYRFENIHGEIKKTNEEILKIDSVEVSLAWRELFRGRIVTDIEVYDCKLIVTNLLLKSDSFKKEEQKNTLSQAKDAKEKLFPVKVESLTFRDSTLQFAETLNLPIGERLMISNMQSSIINLTPEEKRPLTLLSAEGTLMNSTNIQIAGFLKMLKKPMDWDLDIETKQFDLASANPVLKRLVPITFKKGSLDLYMEVKDEGGHMAGYAKPFLRNLEIIGNNSDFSSVKHFFVELGTTIANAVLKNPKTKAFATQINFNDNHGKLEFHTGAAIDAALENAEGSGLKPALNNTIKLKDERN